VGFHTIDAMETHEQSVLFTFKVELSPPLQSANIFHIHSHISLTITIFSQEICYRTTLSNTII
jgi:hypothetical protein